MISKNQSNNTGFIGNGSIDTAFSLNRNFQDLSRFFFRWSSKCHGAAGVKIELPCNPLGQSLVVALFI